MTVVRMFFATLCAFLLVLYVHPDFFHDDIVKHSEDDASDDMYFVLKTEPRLPRISGTALKFLEPVLTQKQEGPEGDPRDYKGGRVKWMYPPAREDVRAVARAPDFSISDGDVLRPVREKPENAVSNTVVVVVDE